MNQRQFLGRPLSLAEVQQYAPSAFAEGPHASRSSRYAYIPTSRVIEGLVKQGFVPYSATQSVARTADHFGFTKHLIRFRHPDAKVLAVGDTVPEIALENSHDGSSTYNLFAAFF